MARASSSFPVPLAPKMHTEASDAATRRACASKSSIAEERVISSALHSSMSPKIGLDNLIASATVSSSTLGSKGFVKNENTPRRVAATASGAPSAQSATLTVWLQTDAQAANWEPIVKAANAQFQKDHPGVTVNVQ